MLTQLDKLAVIDFETTQSPTGLRAVEIAVILVERGRVSKSVEELINPDCAIDPYSRDIHGISDEDVQDAPRFGQLWESLEPLFSGAVLLAHNAPFDSGVLKNEILRNRISPPDLEWWCTLRLARRVWPGRFRSYSLSNLARELKLEAHVTHRAMDDAETAWELFKCQVASAGEGGPGGLHRIREMALHTGGRSWPW